MRRRPPWFLPVFCLLVLAAYADLRAGQVSAEQVLKETGITAGLCVVVGAGDGSLPLQLAQSGRFLIHVLERDRGLAEAAAALLAKQGRYGQVSVEHWVEESLPYADSLVNLLVGEEPKGLSAGEVQRALRPFGVAYLGKAGAWSKTVKPWTKGLDEWSHARHGADGNLVSRDTVLEVPKRIQWIATGLGSNFLSGGGSNYYGTRVRDAFNSLPLWESPMPIQVASGERAFGLSGGALVALDTRSGAQMLSYSEAGSVQSFIHVPEAQGAGVLVVWGGALRAVDVATGKRRWEHPVGSCKHLLGGDGKAFCTDGGQVLCVDLSSGKEDWKVGHPFAAGAPSAAYRSGVLLFHGTPLSAVSTKDGSLLWQKPLAGEVAFAGELLWGREGGKEVRKVVGLDPKTGEARKTISTGYGHCHGLMATDRFFIDGELDFTDLGSGARQANQITKAACGGRSYLPANGMLYSFSSGCICFPMLKDSMALAPESAAPAPAKGGVRMQKGTVSTSQIPVPKGGASAAEWPLYRHDVWRSGCTSAAVGTTLSQLWRTPLEGGRGQPLGAEWARNPLEGPLTAPTVAEGLVFVAVTDTHSVVALEAGSGKVRWRFTANGRVDTPPTIHNGICLFGTRAGWIYGLAAATGELVWRFRVGPQDRRMVAYGQLESAWPVPGTILVDQGVAYAAAGRHALADGGFQVCAFDPRSGALKWELKIDSIPMPTHRWYGRLGNDFDVFDILAKDGEELALSRWNIDPRAGKVTGDRRKGFFAARSSGVAILRGLWSYSGDRPNNRGRSRRGLAVFNDETLFSSGGSLVAATLEKAAAAGAPGSSYLEPPNSPREYQIAWSPYATLEKLPRKWTMGDGGARGLVVAGETLFVAGGNGLNAYACADGSKKGHWDLGAQPVWDGMAAAYGRLFIAAADGSVLCVGDASAPLAEAAPATPVGAKVVAAERPREAGKAQGEGAASGGPAAGGGVPAPAADEWRARLLAEARKELEGGRKPSIQLHAMKQTFRIASLDEKGGMLLENKTLSLPQRWERLVAADLASLAVSLAAQGDQARCLLAGYFSLLAGEHAQADGFFQKVKDLAAVKGARAAAQAGN